MKRNLKIVVAVIVAVSLTAFFVLREKPAGEAHWGVKAHEIMERVFHFETTNTWRDVKASGGVTISSMGRKRVEYFLVQAGNLNALDEMRSKFDSREKGHDLGAFSYLTNYDPSPWRIKGSALQLAPWWNNELEGVCTFVQLGTNVLGTTWSARLYVYARGSNAVLYTHIIENVE